MGHRCLTGLACLLLLVVASALVGAQTRPLRLVSTRWAPFTNQHGQPRYALDLVEAALSRIRQPSETTIVDAAQFTPALLTGDFDGSAAAWQDADRERVLLFSEPYLENRLVLVGRKSADVTATTLGALSGRRIALIEGYAYGEDVEKSGPTFVRARSDEDEAAVLRRRQHLSRLGVRARSLQDVRRHAPESVAIDREPVPLFVVTAANQARTSIR